MSADTDLLLENVLHELALVIADRKRDQAQREEIASRLVEALVRMGFPKGKRAPRARAAS